MRRPIKVFRGQSLCQVALVFKARKQLIVKIKCTGRDLTSDLCRPRGCFCVCRAHHPGICPPWTLWDGPLQPARARLEFPVLRQRQHSDHGYWCLEISLPTPTVNSILSRSFAPLSYPLIRVRVDSETPLQRGGFKSGDQACICVSKVRLRCRMLSFAGWWLQSEQDDNADPRGWRVKWYGKTWINRGPGILPDSMWPKLPLNPMGAQGPEVETKPCGSYCYFCVYKGSLQSCWPAHLWCFSMNCASFSRTSISEYWLTA